MSDGEYNATAETAREAMLLLEGPYERLEPVEVSMTIEFGGAE